ncbi:hypothetical protein ADUPG1_011625, partial [Aduncisulcus paluster]
GYSD